ncbi:MAG: UDP-N-acetylmuramoyl-tripeptide--D-alanyl-D-alanine ligase [Paracoccaceae bacterium]
MSSIFSADELHSVVGGKLFKKNWKVHGISIDSREIKNNDLFIALKSKRDGNDFIISAIEKGAKAAIINKVPIGLPTNFPYILVKDSMQALHAIAKYSRKRYKGNLIAITGSVGKTSTKDILTKILSVFGLTHSSPKSFNNHLGVPLTLANIPQKADYVICEIGMNAKGEIEPLSKLASPDIAIITNISTAHLASFNCLREIAQEKASICEGLKKNGLLIYPIDNDFCNLFKGIVFEKNIKSTTFGSKKVADISLDRISFLNNKSFASLVLDNKTFSDFSIGALGYHQLLNCLAAIGVILSYDLDLRIALKELKKWKPRNGRGRFLDIIFKKNLKKIKIRIIDESYNCNPSSLNASFEILKNAKFVTTKKKSRKVAILGDMLELGINEKKFHSEVSNNDKIKFFDKIHCVGSLMKELHSKLPKEKKGLLVSKPKDLISHILINAEDRDIYLIKGSNSIGLSFIVDKLYDLNNGCF